MFLVYQNSKNLNQKILPNVSQVDSLMMQLRRFIFTFIEKFNIPNLDSAFARKVKAYSHSSHSL